MQVRDSVIIIFGEQRSHGDNVLRVVVLDGTEIAKLPFSGCIVGYDVGSLHVDAFAPERNLVIVVLIEIRIIEHSHVFVVDAI